MEQLSKQPITVTDGNGILSTVCVLYVFIFNIQSRLRKSTLWGRLELCLGISKSVYSEYKEGKEKRKQK